MVNLGSSSGKKSLNTVTLIFKLPYYTQWGQSLLVAGSSPSLGSWNIKQGLSLCPVHEGNELIWCGRVSVVADFTCEYSYYVVDDNRNVLRWEAGEKRKLVLPDGVQDGDMVELRDGWKDASDALFLRSAFKNVIFNASEKAKTELETAALNKSLEPEEFVVQFIISCPRLGAGSTVVITGSNPQLGNWRAQDGLKLNYVGDSIWKAHCLLRKSEFPIEYKYCQISQAGVSSLEFGPNREAGVDLSSPKPSRYILLSDGALRSLTRCIKKLFTFTLQ